LSLNREVEEKNKTKKLTKKLIVIDELFKRVFLFVCAGFFPRFQKDFGV